MSIRAHPMTEPTPYDDFSPGPHRDRLRRQWLEFEESRRKLRAEAEESRAQWPVLIRMVKQQEAALARRRCWLF